MADKKISALTAATTPLVGSEVLPIVQGASTVKVSVDNLTAGKAVSFLSSASGLGAVATPSYTFTGDTNTGMWSPAADTIAFSANGAERLRVAAGTVSVTGVLNTSTGVVGNIASFSDGIAQTITIATGAGYAEIRNPNAGAIIFSNPTTRMNISAAGDVTVSTGNVIIGTAGKGIDFSANGGDILSQYDEGTYTPVFTASSSNPTVTYGLQRGKYVRVGNSVTVSVFITWSAFSGGSGDLQISLPFAGESSVGAGGAGSISDLTGFTFAAGRTFCSIRPNSNVLYATFPQSGSLVSTSNTTVAQTAASGLIVFSTTYLI
jgi:hypothetical protein